MAAASQPSLQQDEAYMRYALRLAARMAGRTMPNPLVGCVLVKEGQVIATGVTQPGGRPHAEVMALELAGDAARGATAYVTLEPCSHHGKTPPCAEALIKAGVARVVIAMQDPSEKVAGNGIALLEAAGIAVQTGICEAEANTAHQGFVLREMENRPLIWVKAATSLDGKMALANGQSQWITSEASRHHAHGMRAEVDAVLTGSGTVLADNPQFTCRLPGLERASPIRIVLDRRLRIPADHPLFPSAHDVPVWVVAPEAAWQASAAHQTALESQGVTCLQVPDAALASLWPVLAQHGITRLLVEAGPELTSAVIAEGRWDRLYWYQAPMLLGDDGKAVMLPQGYSVLETVPRYQTLDRLPLGPDSLTVLAQQG